MTKWLTWLGAYGFSGNKGGKAEMSESCHMQRERTWKRMSRRRKTTVIVRKANLLNLSKPKEKGVKGEEGRGGKERSERERGDQGNGRVGEEKRVSKC